MSCALWGSGGRRGEGPCHPFPLLRLQCDFFPPFTLLPHSSSAPVSLFLTPLLLRASPWSVSCFFFRSLCLLVLLSISSLLLLSLTAHGYFCELRCVCVCIAAAAAALFMFPFVCLLCLCVYSFAPFSLQGIAASFFFSPSSAALRSRVFCAVLCFTLRRLFTPLSSPPLLFFFSPGHCFASDRLLCVATLAKVEG